MSLIPLRGEPEGELFCLWSTETDGVAVFTDGTPVIGTRAELEDWWREEFGRRGKAEEVFERTARNGTAAESRIGPHVFGSWEDDPLDVEHPTRGRLPRNRLGEYLCALHDGDQDAAAALLDPPEDDDDAPVEGPMPQVSRFGGHVHIDLNGPGFWNGMGR